VNVEHLNLPPLMKLLNGDNADASGLLLMAFWPEGCGMEMSAGEPQPCAACRDDGDPREQSGG